MKKTLKILGLIFGMTLLTYCQQNKFGNMAIWQMLFDSSGNKGYEIDGEKQGLSALKKEYEIYIQMNFPESLKELAAASVENWKEFVRHREKQDLLIVQAMKQGLTKDPEFQYLLKQGVREAIVKAYLYKNIPNIGKIKEAQFTEDRAFLEKVYLENQEAYKAKNIKKEDAIGALKKVYSKKKKAVIDYIIVQEQDKIIENLQKRIKVEEGKELLLGYPNENKTKN